MIYQRRRPAERDDLAPVTAPHLPLAQPATHAARPEALPPLARAVLDLQATAGNSAVAENVQRQPKTPPAKPAWLQDAQAELGKLFPNDKLMQHVVVKDYGALNAELQTIDYGAWTNSKTEIYVRDPSTLIDQNEPAQQKWPPMLMRYTLRHEAVHIGQFAAAGGPPKTWQAMLEFEQAAYKADVAWLGSTAATTDIPDKQLLALLVAGASKTLASVTAVLNDTKKLKGKKREAEIFKRMKKAELIPKGAKPDPQELYIQPP
jgi:hypothetical protein